MFEEIEKLLVLQDRDRNIARVKEELDRAPGERVAMESKTSSAQTALETARNQLKRVEADRNDLEVEVVAKKQQIDKYLIQQFQTKKNDEYRALNHEIDTVKKAIAGIEDRILDLMEQTEQGQAAVRTATQGLQAIRKVVDEKLVDLAKREANLRLELARLETNRDALAAAVQPAMVSRYERLMKSKGENVVVSVEHGVCGGCHMRLSRQVVVTCQAQNDAVCCPNCGRILYYDNGMDITPAD